MTNSTNPRLEDALALADTLLMDTVKIDKTPPYGQPADEFKTAFLRVRE